MQQLNSVVAQRPQQIFISIWCKIAANVIVDVFGVCSATHSQIVSERQMHPEKYIRVCAFGLTEVDSQLDIADPVLV